MFFSYDLYVASTNCTHRMINRGFFLLICFVTAQAKDGERNGIFLQNEIMPLTFVETTLYFHLVISFWPLKGILARVYSRASFLPFISSSFQR